MSTFTLILAILSAILSALIFLKNRMPGGMVLWFPKLVCGALAPFSALLGAAAFFMSVVVVWQPLTALIGLLASSASLYYLILMTRDHDQFEKAFGKDWQSKISTPARRRLLRQRWTWRLPGVAQPGVKRDLAFWTVPGARGRKLLCDLWTPPDRVERTGLAFIYFHGSDWYLLDKGFGTRTFFRQLAAQGHVVMDVAYRLFPETDIPGMVGDVKRSIVWMKRNAAQYGVNPARIVIGGGSAGGHIALLAAYSPITPDLTPEDTRGCDLTVRGVISEYGPTDLETCYYHTRQHRTTQGKQPKTISQLLPNPASGGWMRALIKDYDRLGMGKPSDAGAFYNLLGGHPNEVLDRYCDLSPITQVHPGCPPTLLIQGEDDLITPVQATRAFYHKLVACGVPAINVILPHTDHAFDLMLPEYSPAAQAALYDIERFLALMVG
jgi:acetyl esterase/lipase